MKYKATTTIGLVTIMAVATAEGPECHEPICNVAPLRSHQPHVDTGEGEQPQTYRTVATPSVGSGDGNHRIEVQPARLQVTGLAPTLVTSGSAPA